MAKQGTAHQERIRRELLAAGVTKAALYKSQLRRLDKILHADEHIEAVVYSTYGSGSGVLLASDRRIMYVDIRPFNYSFDEFTYDIVSGVSLRRQGPLLTVTLHTPISHFTIRTTNRAAAEGFLTCMEIRKIEHLEPPVTTTVTTLPHTT